MANQADARPVLKLPHPYLTSYHLRSASGVPKQLQIRAESSPAGVSHEPLHSDTLSFTEPADLTSSERPHESNNTPWGRARRSPVVQLTWPGNAPPTLGQVWLVIYVIFTLRPGEEFFRLQLAGPKLDIIAAQLKAVSLAIDHPRPAAGPNGQQKSEQFPGAGELLVLRSTFWQGAGSPFGARPVWSPYDPLPGAAKTLGSYPPAPLNYTLSNVPDTALCWHPRRPAKPVPGSVIYSRYIPHLGENFSMVALDHNNEEHVSLFHTWQNDPRVSQGWNETGTLEQHKAYLLRQHEDPHQIAVLARFEDIFFAYFEIYWGKEDKLGAYSSTGDFDRGRHSLVGDVRFRGPHRVSAWWSSLIHYLFLDEPRTMAVVGEPKSTNSTVLSYDFIHGFSLDKFVDLPHKRSGFMRCSRERFFQLCPLAENQKVVGGTGVGLLPKL